MQRTAPPQIKYMMPTHKPSVSRPSSPSYRPSPISRPAPSQPSRSIPGGSRSGGFLHKNRVFKH
jgi:hypothetical protein